MVYTDVKEVKQMEKHRAIPEGYMRIGEMAKKAGITIRTLQYYDKEGLLLPSAASEGGFRLYSDKDMVRLVQILMLKQLGFPLSEIKKRLAQLDTPQDVVTMLADQITQLRKKMEVMAESLDVMEALKKEIQQIETVNFKKYADILLSLQVKNNTNWMIKHIDDDAMDMFNENMGREKTALMTDTLVNIYMKAQELYKEGITPESESGQAFAEMFWTAFIELTGGDPFVMQKISEQMEKVSSTHLQDQGEREAVRHFMKQALNAYHSNEIYEVFDVRMDSEKSASIMDIFSQLYDAAAQLVADEVPPESEQGQNFATRLWASICEISGGDMDIVRKMSGHIDNTNFNEERPGTQALIHHYMKRVLEIYHSK